jgi:hypothetical protein
MAQHERTEASRSTKMKEGGRIGGIKVRGKPRKKYDVAPDWWREEMEL